MSNARWLSAAVLAAVVAGGAALWWWQQQSSPSAEPPPLERPARPTATSAPAEAVPTNQVRYPLEAPDATPAATDPQSILVDLFGRSAALAAFNLDEFPRRVAATVDNLGRSTAAASLWPVRPARDKFLVERRADAELVSADNSLRYTPFVLLVEGVDMERAAAAYRTLYPLFQQAYEELGYPGKYFNDRVVDVIDLMLATPPADARLRVQLPEVHGPIAPERPWVTYRFEDPALESLAAGQKILLRMGPVNERRMKAKLAEFRALIVKPKAR